MPDVKGYNLPNHSETYMYADAKVRNAGYGDAPKIILDTASDNDGSLLNAALDNVLATMAQDETKQVLFYSYPNITNAYCLGTLYKHNDNEAVVSGIHYRDNSGSFLKKKANGTWLPHEWENPPMALGVEYRTTERWNGKVVYTAAADFGALPNNTSKSMTVSCTQGATHLVDLRMIIHNENGVCDSNLLSSNSCVHWVDIISSGLRIGLQTSDDSSSHHLYCTFKYVKE